MTLKIEHTAYSAAEGDRRDCSVRALSIAANLPYEHCSKLFAHHGRKRGHATPTHISDGIHDDLGMQQVPLLPRGWLTVTRFIAEHPVGRFVVHRRGHAFAIIDGVIHDWSRGTGPRSRIKKAWRVK
jgi:hypothetical protein